MDKRITLLLAYIACLLVSLTYATETIEDNKNDLCELTTAKRLLSSLGMSSESPHCLLQQNRDIEHLVTSFLETIFTNPVKKELRSENVKALNDKRRGYCCSPKCDRFMFRLGYPHSSLIVCT